MGERAARVWVLRAALLCFIIAGATGTLYRFGLVYGWPSGLNPVNGRHAHSHLMYFGWVTPLLIALIGSRVASGSDTTRLPGWILGGAFVAAAVSYPLFLAYGYTPLAIGSRRMPIAVMGSTLNMVFWVAFVVWYVRQTRGGLRSHAHGYWDASVVFMMLAVLGAGMLALLKPLGIDSPVWSTALTHIFLDYFSEGWFVLGVLGVLHYRFRTSATPLQRAGLLALCAGIPLTFALGMPSSFVHPALAIPARVGGVLVGAGLLINVTSLWFRVPSEGRWLWRLPLLFLALKAFAQAAGAMVPGVWWSDVHGMRVLYLHLMLLGFVTLMLVRLSMPDGREHTVMAMSAAVTVVLLSLVPLSPLGSGLFSGFYAHVIAAWVSVTPVVVAGALMMRANTSVGPGGTRFG